MPVDIIEAARRPALLSYVRNRQCVLFVGAGLSRPAGYPGWRDLMTTVVQHTGEARGASTVTRELGDLLEAGRFAELADQCRELLGRQRFASLLREELDRPALPPEATHRAIVETPYASIVTTNFDTLLEDAYALWSDEGVPKCPTGAQLGRHGTLLLDRTFFILKAHGTIREAASLVFTSEDYRRITHANPAFQAMMSAILLSHAVLFVGYSLSDPNFRLLLDGQLSVFGAQAPPRYALMEGIGSTEAQILRRTTGIEAISYPKGEHESVATFLGEIAAATRSNASRRGGASTVLRARAPLPCLRVEIRPRDAMLDMEWFETTTDDFSGLRVPLEQRSMGSTASLSWSDLLAVSSELGGSFSPAAIRQVGAAIARPFADLGVPLVDDAAHRVVILDVPNELAAIPWEWTLVRKQPLCLQAPVCRRVPGLDDASRGRPFFHAPLRVLVIGDALAESALHHHALPGTRAEAQEIARLFTSVKDPHEVTVLVGRDASYTRVLEALSTGYDIVHLAGVAYIDDNGESVVPLHDGWVSASELATLLIQRPPGLLFVNEDCSGFVPWFGDGSAPAGDGTQSGAFADFYHRLQQRRPGLERVVARAGVGVFIGCMAPAQEDTARDLAVSFYSHLLAGNDVSQALCRARQEAVRDNDPTHLLFAMAGYADTRIVETSKRTRPAARSVGRPVADNASRARRRRA
jgi:hypothetical protein